MVDALAKQDTEMNCIEPEPLFGVLKCFTTEQQEKWPVEVNALSQAKKFIVRHTTVRQIVIDLRKLDLRTLVDWSLPSKIPPQKVR